MFRAGWYENHFDPKTFRSRCRYFRTPSPYTAECIIESNGQQLLLLEDPNGPTGAGRPAQWSGGFRALANADNGDWWGERGRSHLWGRRGRAKPNV